MDSVLLRICIMSKIQQQSNGVCVTTFILSCISANIMCAAFAFERRSVVLKVTHFMQHHTTSTDTAFCEIRERTAHYGYN